MGVVYHANYFRYFETGRTELLRAAGLDYRSFEAMGFKLPVTCASARYLSPARYDDELMLVTTVAQVRRGSLHMEYELSRESDSVAIATGVTTHACVGENGRVCRLPEPMLQALNEDRAEVGGAQ